MNDQEYSYLKIMVAKLIKLDLDAYKSQQMRRRLDGFIARSNSSSVAEYCRMLEQDREQQNKLQNFLPINVSEFFRDQPQFRRLKDLVLTKLLRRNSRLNIWSAACSCGQEPYTIAIMLEELCPHHNHRILATDIDGQALEQARSGGPYPPAEIRNVDKQLLQRFFVKAEDGCRVVDRIKRAVEFRQQDLLRNVFERGFDLVVCRNVVIYFCDEAKNKLYEKFYHSLKEDGVLFTGGTEVILQTGALGFAQLCPSFYRKVSAPRELVALPSRV